MIVKVHPARASGSVKIPPSKSMAHRAIICASLAQGKSRIDNVAYSKDIETTIAGMRSLGAKITTFQDYVEIEGIQDFTHIQNTTIDCSESGSTLRFFIPIFSLTNQPITFTGSPRLMERPQSVYADVFQKQNLPFQQRDGAIRIEKSLHSGNFTLAGDVSSQFISGLLFILPLLENDSSIHIEEPFESRSYVDLTIQMLTYFGIKVAYLDKNTIKVEGNQSYGARNYTIEGDYSQLAFFACLAALSNDLEITGVNHDSLQGDKAIINILRNAQVKIDEIPHGYKVYKSDVIGTSIDLADCPDLGPILCTLSAFAKGKTHIYHAERLRIKESDRIVAMEEELRKLGVEITSTQGDIYLNGASTYVGNCTFDAHNDHRIVMSMAVAASLCDIASTIHDAQAINKSYPSFFEDFIRCGIEVSFYE